MSYSSATTIPAFAEHHVPREGGNLYVRDFAGTGTPFVLLHGFPDNAKIYDDLIPHLVSAGRRVVTLDFLGFGASDKPGHFHYSFEQQLADLQVVVLRWGSGPSFQLHTTLGDPLPSTSRFGTQKRLPRSS